MSDRARVLQTSRILSLAIALGPALFLGVVFFLLHREGSGLGAGETAPTISYAALLFALGGLGAAFTVPRAVAARSKEPLHAFQQTVVLRAAMLEAPALLGCVAYMLEGKVTPIGAAVALTMIGLLAGSIPTESRLDSFLAGRDAAIRS